MNFEEYHAQTGETADYPRRNSGDWIALSYVGLGLVGEAGEIANQLKKVVRDDGGVVVVDRRAKLLDEMGDVFWYLSQLCHELNADPAVVFEMNRVKLQERKREGTIQGDRRSSILEARKRGEVLGWLTGVVGKALPVPTEEDLADGWAGEEK
jgi:NTP pyrophosphatase (non-canonical NTP hydrolase)